MQALLTMNMNNILFVLCNSHVHLHIKRKIILWFWIPCIYEGIFGLQNGWTL